MPRDFYWECVGNDEEAWELLKSQKLAELFRLRARRAKAVRQMRVVAVAERDGAEQHLFRRHADKGRDQAMHARPGFLGAGVEAMAACEQREGLHIAAEIGPLAGTELAIDGDEQRHWRIEEFVIALEFPEPAFSVVTVDAERAVKLYAVILAPRLVGLPHRLRIDRIFGVVVMARIAAGDMVGDLLLERGKRRAGERIDLPGLQ